VMDGHGPSLNQAPDLLLVLRHGLPGSSHVEPGAVLATPHCQQRRCAGEELIATAISGTHFELRRS
jgi:hypothetical protein